MPPKIIPFSAVRKNVYDTVKERQENIIGLRIQEARTRRGLSLAELSTLLAENGLTIQRQGIGKWEAGISVPNAYQLLALCDALRIEDGITFFTGNRELFGELDDVGLRKVEEYREDLIASGRYKRHKVERQNIINYIDMRVALLPASAGTGSLTTNSLKHCVFQLILSPKMPILGSGYRAIAWSRSITMARLCGFSSVRPCGPEKSGYLCLMVRAFLKCMMRGSRTRRILTPLSAAMGYFTLSRSLFPTTRTMDPALYPRTRCFLLPVGS